MSSTTRPTDLPPGATADDLDDVMTPEMDDAEAAWMRPIGEAPPGLTAVLPQNGGSTTSCATGLLD